MTPEGDGSRRRSPLTWAVPLVLVVVAIVGAVALRRDPEAPPPAPATTTAPAPDPVAVASDAPTFTTLDELIAASDLVVRGRVTDTERGRWFGDGSDGALTIASSTSPLKVKHMPIGSDHGMGYLSVQ